MVERTLFNPTRRPAPVAVAEAAKPRIQRGQFALTGTIMVEGKAYAFLRESNGGKARRVAKGDTINGMVVTEVKPDRIRSEHGRRKRRTCAQVGGRTPDHHPARRGRFRPVAVCRAAPGAVPVAAQPPQVRDVSEVLAERRRAARAAEAAAAGRAARAADRGACSECGACRLPAGAAMQPAAAGTLQHRLRTRNGSPCTSVTSSLGDDAGGPIAIIAGGSRRVWRDPPGT